MSMSDEETQSNSGGLSLWMSELSESLDSEMSEDKFESLVTRITQLNREEFDDFIYSLFDYLMRGWEKKRNFRSLGVVIDLLDVVLGMAPQEVRNEIESALKSCELWHVRFPVCWELFEVPEGELTTKNEDTLPLELLLIYKNGNGPPYTLDSSLLQRIHLVKNKLVYKSCLLILEKVFKLQESPELQTDLLKVEEDIKKLIGKYPQSVPRIRQVLLKSLSATSHLSP